MVIDTDIIGLVATWHKRFPANAQERALLAAGVSAARIIHLENVRQRDKLVNTAPAGRVLAINRAWLVADPAALRKSGGLRAEWARFMKRATARGVIVWDVESGIRTATPGGLIDMLDRVAHGLANSGRGLRSKGRPPAKFAPDVIASAKLIWRDLIEFPTYADVRAALPAGFTVERCGREWGPRRPRKANRRK